MADLSWYPTVFIAEFYCSLKQIENISYQLRSDSGSAPLFIAHYYTVCFQCQLYITFVIS